MKRIYYFLLAVLAVFFFPVLAFAQESSDFVIDFSKIHYDVDTSSKELKALQLLLDEGVFYNTSFDDAISNKSYTLVYHNGKKGLLYVNPLTGEFLPQNETIEYELEDDSFEEYDRIVVLFQPFQGDDSDTLVLNYTSREAFLDSPDVGKIILDYLVEKKKISILEDKDTDMVYLSNSDGKTLLSYSLNDDGAYTVFADVSESDNISLDLDDEFYTYFFRRYGHPLPQNYQKVQVLFHTVQLKTVDREVQTISHNPVSRTHNYVACGLIFLGMIVVCGGLYLLDGLIRKKILKKQSQKL